MHHRSFSWSGSHLALSLFFLIFDSSVGNQIGMGKESDIYIVANSDDLQLALKVHRYVQLSKQNCHAARGLHNCALFLLGFMKLQEAGGQKTDEEATQKSKDHVYTVGKEDNQHRVQGVRRAARGRRVQRQFRKYREHRAYSTIQKDHRIQSREGTGYRS